MESSFNFHLSKKTPLSRQCFDKNLTQFEQVCAFVKHLPYGRNTCKNDLSLVLSEHRGTCSTKHAFLAQLAYENNRFDIQLCLGIYKMNASNTSGLKGVLEDFNLSYIPEAHTYLRYNDLVLDYTSSIPPSFEKFLLHEDVINPNQISDYKVNVHQTYLKKWILETSVPHTFEGIWNIRELCIAHISM